jgi:F0F1-type ATP synthase assembly protein I
MRDDGADQPRSLQRLSETIRRAGPAATASYSLIGAIVLFGGLGYLVDRWLQTSPWLMFGGLMVGLVVGFYQLAMTVWRR